MSLHTFTNSGVLIFSFLLAYTLESSVKVSEKGYLLLRAQPLAQPADSLAQGWLIGSLASAIPPNVVITALMGYYLRRGRPPITRYLILYDRAYTLLMLDLFFPTAWSLP
jgi:hypothetical protein